jgi:GxxExxY protein
MNSIFERVFNTLGPGFTECVYHKAVEVEFRRCGIPYDSEVIVPITYENHIVGHVRCDIVLTDCVIEFKSVAKLNEDHRQQLRNYLKLLNKDSGLLVNFGTMLSVEEISHPTESDDHLNPV